jgi:serine/threonine-protein kinase
MHPMVLAERYRLDEQISSGDAGDRWRGTDLSTGQAIVAILEAIPADDPSYAKRVELDWARPMATIDHPRVLRVRDTGVDPEAGLYVITDHVDGESLQEFLARAGRLTPARTMDLVVQVADALSAIHGRGILHRELSPAMVVVRPDSGAVLPAFGLNRLVTRPERMLEWGPEATNFVAPEEIQGMVPGYGADIFRLGVIAYRCLAGRLPFEGDHVLAVAVQVFREQPPPLPPDVPATVRSIVERAMAKDPADRWPTAAELADAAAGADPRTPG